jgi:tRNA-specific 2-thiouridylase
VIDPFVDAYLQGRTPSPCVSCNRTVKLRELLPLADRLGASHVATGHYARVVPDAAGRARLHRGRDRSKDQSYFLHMLSADELARVIFPLGEATKREVREEALARGLPGATKGESQELCFVSSGRYDEFVAREAPERLRPGPIVDADGRQVGRHDGVHRFTIGQRKGLGVALGRPAFVTGIDGENATVRLGGEDALLAIGARLTDACFNDDVTLPLEAEVRVRARHDGARATLSFARDAQNGDVLTARFAEPVRAVSPGQIAVAYSGDRVLGGATIVEAVCA